MDFAERLKTIRKERGYTQELLAKASRVQLKTIQNYEQGLSNPVIDYLLSLAEVLDVTPEYLYKGERHMNTYTAAITYELKQIDSFGKLEELKHLDFNETILSHLELGEPMITELADTWVHKGLFEGDSVCYRNYVKDVVIKYCQNRNEYKKRWFQDGMVASVGD